MQDKREFLPISKEDMKQRGWQQCDFVFVIGDAYVDHASFGPAVISRHLEANGYKVPASRNWESQDWDFWCVPAIWIPW